MRGPAVKRTLLIAVGVAALGLLSMGVLGGLLYYAACPVLFPFYGDLNDWRGDDVWPATIAAGMLWPLSFPVAAWALARLESHGVSRALRYLAGAAILWLGAVLVWSVLLRTMAIQVSAV